MIDLSKTIDLSKNYLGLKLKNPLVASSSPLCEDLDAVRRMEDCGAGAVVLQSLFEEQIEYECGELDRFLGDASERGAEAFTHFPELISGVTGPEEYLEHIRKCKRAVRTPVIASLNGSTLGGWLRYARQIQQAGADRLGVNIYHLPVDPDLTGEEVERLYIDLVKSIKDEVNPLWPSSSARTSAQWPTWRGN